MKKSLLVLTIALFFVSQNSNAQQWSPITSNNVWNLNSGNLGIGTTTPLFKLDVNGEIKSTLTGVSNLRMVGGGYAAMLRNDGINTYLLYTNVNDVNGGWNSLRPIRIDNSNGNVYLAGENVIMNHNTGNVGIGINPEYKLDVNGKLFLRTVDVVSGWNRSYLNWTGHSLIMGSPVGNYIYNSIDLEPGGCSQAPLYSQLRMYTAVSQTQKDLKIQFNTMGNCFINNDGNVGIGYSTPTVKLDVNGTIRAKEIKVCLNQGCDFVFDDNYSLMPIDELKNYVKSNKHLPDIAPAKEMENNGINLSEMNAQLLRKIEELTLYVIQQQEKIDALEKKLK